VFLFVGLDRIVFLDLLEQVFLVKLEKQDDARVKVATERERRKRKDQMKRVKRQILYALNRLGIEAARGVRNRVQRNRETNVNVKDVGQAADSLARQATIGRHKRDRVDQDARGAKSHRPNHDKQYFGELEPLGLIQHRREDYFESFVADGHKREHLRNLEYQIQKRVDAA
jgi:hypothetical protein